MSQILVLGFFFTARRICLSSTVVVFLHRPVQLFQSPPLVSFFLKTFQTAVLDISSFCAIQNSSVVTAYR
uniref:Secreted protein n=1 Tax=Anguilla anguilla TaxID=7936 RepID=A0A0E9WMB4_ANGAN